MATTPWAADMRIKTAERKIIDALGMYTDAIKGADETSVMLSAGRVQEMVRGKPELRRAFGVDSRAPGMEGT
jgi:hypothetical protein